MTDTPIWQDKDLAANANPHEAEDKARRVRDMFAAIAPSYDRNNRVHALGRDQAWRKLAVRMCKPQAGERVLDCACGTGDLTLAFLRTMQTLQQGTVEAQQIVGLDFTQEMLDGAQHKKGASECEWIQGDAMALPFEDASFDVVSIAFGLRNVQQPDKALAEFYRVLKPGGRLMVLEFDQVKGLLGVLYRFYFHRIMPITASWIARDKSGAYKYLPKSVETFFTRKEMKTHLETIGFQVLQQKPLSCGIAVAHLAFKQGEV